MMVRWTLTVGGLIVLIGMFILLLAGIHMLIQPQAYVGRGPIPAQSAGNVRAMGVLFAILSIACLSPIIVPNLFYLFS